MRRDIQGGNFPLCPGLPQDVGKGGGARWRVERRWCKGMSHVKWKIWKMSPRWNVENVSRGEFLRQGGGQVTRCSNRYNPPMSLQSWYGWWGVDYSPAVASYNNCLLASPNQLLLSYLCWTMLQKISTINILMDPYEDDFHQPTILEWMKITFASIIQKAA